MNLTQSGQIQEDRKYDGGFLGRTCGVAMGSCLFNGYRISVL